jgi:undecaprenyl diphosphate synthase
MALPQGDRLDPASYQITKLPKHVAIIMDGNGRWATQRGFPRILGHREGAKAVQRVVKIAYRLGVRHLTLFAFSTQNWGRPSDEVDGLMVLLLDYLRSEAEELMDREIRFRTLGDASMLPPKVREEVDRFQARSQDNEAMDLNIALSYGAREEILHAVQRVAREVKEGKLSPEAITEELFSSYLYAPEVPDPDLMIRTSGELRVSNFMLWQIAYTELHVTPVLWPDFTDEHFIQAMQDYSGRQRRYGLTGQQASALVPR